MLTFEALRAQFGDSLIIHYGDAAAPNLIVIDGGPTGVFADALHPRLDEIRKERKLAADKPLEIELMMLSHIDADHITGLIDLMSKQKELSDQHKPLPLRILRFWHNSFDDIIGNASGAAVASASMAASVEAASVAQGRQLRNLISAFNLAGNKPFNGLAMLGADKNPATIEGMKLTVVGPSKPNIEALQKQWDKEIKPLLAKEHAHGAEVAAFIDNSVPNLASIIALAEFGGKRILLTGDGRGDHTLKGLETAGVLQPGGKMEIDILKLPHHGSVRDVAPEYFERIRAKHYVASANGRDDNPDVATLQLISDARPDDQFTFHLTNPTDEFVKPEIGKAVAAFFAKEKAKGRKYKVEIRKPDELSVKIDL